ncbi:maleylacetate reductase [Curvibacter sp. HBC61]|uniref:Maleylacetate reductase n=1 Tax=Curvibacter cyanobacteriorum TaxID=3026422 RepID=A0ABT5N0E6_9BURK|nr:maleylacetate reductase [Curvibacter sp. HBC61]MDD0839600.1 maleylacetate reductase [Curvibacter sp. HBC61]
MMDFIYQAQSPRVVFGRGALQHLEREIDALGARRALVLSTPPQATAAHALAERLGERAAGVFSKAVMHVPIESAQAAREVARQCQADCAIALGGGSTIGLGKALALTSGLPIVAIPTTYAGSEMTPIYGITEAGLKKTGRDPRVLPRTVLYDPLLSSTLPVGLSVCSGLNAIAHAAEGLYASDSNPILDLMAEDGVRALVQALPVLHQQPQQAEARAQALYGAWLCGSVLGQVSMALHHKLCHTLGGSFNLPHAETHSVVLPHALAFNLGHAPVAAQRLARAMGIGSPANVPGALWDLARDLGAPTSLRELGLSAEDVDTASALAMTQQYPNPRPLTHRAVRHLLQQAHEGIRPSAA